LHDNYHFNRTTLVAGISLEQLIMKLDDALFRELLDNLYDGVYFVDTERTILFWNKGAERLTGYRKEEVIGSHCWDHLLRHVNCEGVLLCQHDCPLHASMQNGMPAEDEIFLHHKDGHRLPVRVKVSPLRDGTGAVVGAIEVFSDNSEKIHSLEIIQELERKVFLDPLTGLANRRYMDAALPARFDELQRYGWPFGVVMIDIDHFKYVNDRFGHDVGDETLKMLSRTLLGGSRSSDIIGRWGGEEFIAVLTNVTALKLRSSAERYRVLVEQSSLPMEFGQIRVTISAGATLVIPADTPETIIKRADNLLYQSKAAGRNRVTGD
jgi:diguanylate cyclase (GGDEF)-like protein/PAS domain S-box-containing protein